MPSNDEFGREARIVRNAMGGRLGGNYNSRLRPQSDDSNDGGKKNKKSNKPQLTRRVNIKIDRKNGGFSARISTGMFGKHKDFVSDDIETLMSDLSASATRAFNAGTQNEGSYNPQYTNDGRRYQQPESEPAQQSRYPATPSPPVRVMPQPLIATPLATTVTPPLDETTNCQKCGDVVGYAKFCSTCGTRAPDKPLPPPPTQTTNEEQPDLTQCAKCSSPVPYSKYCLDCGTKAPDKPVAKSRFCGDCGSQVEVNKKFCSNCGAKV